MYGHSYRYRLFYLVNTCLWMTLLSGCAISKSESSVSMSWKKPQWVNPLALFSGEKTTDAENAVADSETTTEKTTEKTTEQKTASAENPFGEETPSPKKTGADAEVKLASSNQETDLTRFEPAASNSGFDQATIMLIQTEFKDVSPEERKKWYEELRQVPPSMVPQILRMRRLSQKSQNNMASTDRTSFKLASESRRNSRNELSRNSSWDNQKTSSVQTALANRYLQSENSSGQQVLSTSYANKTETTNSDFNSTTPPPITTDLNKNLNADVDSKDYLETLDQFISVAEQRVASLQPGESEQSKQQYIASHAYLRMLYLMANRQERALEVIPNITAADQEFWQQMFWAMSNYFDTEGIPNSSDRATHTVSQLSEAIDGLRQRANLELRNVVFSTKIDGFGSYDRFERAEFHPGQPVLIYSEVRNFLSDPTSNGQYKTTLKSTIEIHRGGTQGGFISKQEFPPTEDICRNRRNDYFHSYLLNIPQDLPVGPYVLKLIVEDQLNHKVASYMINFSIN